MSTEVRPSKQEVPRFDMCNVSTGWDAVYKMVVVLGGDWVRFEDYERLRAALARIKPLTERRHGTNYVGRMLAIERVITGALEAAPADETTAEQKLCPYMSACGMVCKWCGKIHFHGHHEWVRTAGAARACSRCGSVEPL